jgi:hypothetical protein
MSIITANIHNLPKNWGFSKQFFDLDIIRTIHQKIGRDEYLDGLKRKKNVPRVSGRFFYTV